MVLQVLLNFGHGNGAWGIVFSGVISIVSIVAFSIWRDRERRPSSGLERTLLQATPLNADTLGILFSVVGEEDQVPADAMIFPWKDLVEFSPVEPWPNVRLATTADRALLRPARSRDAAEFASALDDVFDKAKHHGAPNLIMDKGWLRFAVVEPETVAAFPEQQGAAGYRETGKAETIIATREPSPTDPSPEKPLPPYSERYAIVASRAVLTDRALYVETEGHRIVRLPMEKLRASKYVDGDETVFTFGRNTFVRVAEPMKCQLAKAMLVHLKKN